jgi:hypothetical protein
MANHTGVVRDEGRNNKRGANDANVPENDPKS